jgi:HlyD family secretion protein
LTRQNLLLPIKSIIPNLKTRTDMPYFDISPAILHNFCIIDCYPSIVKNKTRKGLIMYKKFLFKVTLLILAIAALALAGCSTSNSTQSASATQTGVVSNVTVTDSIETTGSLDASQLASLAWNTSGTVEKVNASVGQQVKEGDVLAILKADTVPASIISAKADLVTAQHNLENVKNSTLSQANAQVALANAQTAYDTAKKKNDNLKNKRATGEMIKFQEAKLSQANDMVDRAQGAFNSVSDRAPNDPSYTSAYTNLYNAKRNRDSALATLNWYKGTPSSTDVATIEADLALAEANLNDAQREWDRLKSGTDTSDIMAAQAKVDAAQATVNSMAIIAPFSGEVIAVSTTPETLVSSGDLAIVVVNRDTLKVDALVDETDISRVAIGNAAEVKTDAIPGVVFKGKVNSINPIASTVSGLVKFTVTIGLDPSKEPLLFGTTTDVTIVTSEPRSMLAVPVGAVQTDTQGEYVLRVASGGNSERVTVTSDSIQGELVAITGDLKEGDQVLVNATTSTSSGGNQGGPGGGPGGFFGG